MGVRYYLKRMQEGLRALQSAREFGAHEQWSARDIRAYQEPRVLSLVRYAIGHSPFYRDFYAHISLDSLEDLQQLPVLDKKTMMDNYDRIVTDPRLKLRDLENHIGHMTGDEYYLKEYRVVSTGGSTGLAGVFAFNRKEWSTLLASWIRSGMQMGSRPRFSKVLKMAGICAHHPRHMSWRLMESINYGQTRVLSLSAADPLDEIVKALNEFQPENLGMYPSIGALLAMEQLEGRLRINPRIICVSSEVCTGEMKQVMQAAWGKIPFNFYVSTEVLTLGASCTHDKGFHLFDDMAVVEVVDEDNRPVPDGVLGSKILITNLHYFTQPLIRYEITDMVKISPEPCTCGRPGRLIEAVEGRSDDILQLEGAGARPVPVHPIAFRSALGKIHGLRQYQVVRRKDGLHLNLVPLDAEGRQDLGREAECVMKSTLESLSVSCPPVHVHLVDRLERDTNGIGKLKLVKNELVQ